MNVKKKEIVYVKRGVVAMQPNGGVVCICGSMLMTKEYVFHHWQQGHFDVYDKVKEG